MYVKISISNYKTICAVLFWDQCFRNFAPYNDKEENVRHFIFEISDYVEESIEFIREFLDTLFTYDEMVVQMSESVHELVDRRKIHRCVNVKHHKIVHYFVFGKQ